MVTTYELQMLSIAKDLKENFGLTAIKCELESEGVLRSELTHLAEIAWKSGLNLFIKIGGCEAISDLLLCREYDADGIIAPMIESRFAVRKFQAAVETVYADCSQFPSCFINIESESGLNNVDSILSAENSFLTGVTIGRGDLSKSMNISADEINGNIMFSSVESLVRAVKKAGLKCTLGGQIRPNSITFISNISFELDCIETRNLIFSTKNNRLAQEAIGQAITFEQLCLKNRNQHLSALMSRNQHRIDSLIKTGSL